MAVLLPWLVTAFLIKGEGLEPEINKFDTLSALFSDLAFAGLISTIAMQGRDLQMQREELDLNREEMETAKSGIRTTRKRV